MKKPEEKEDNKKKIADSRKLNKKKKIIKTMTQILNRTLADIMRVRIEKANIEMNNNPN